MTRHLVRVDGIDGSGKSTFARRVVSECQRRSIGVVLLRVDDFRRRIDWDRTAADEAATYYDDYYDFARISGCLSAWTNGATTCQVPVFDLVAEAEGPPRTVALGGVDLVVLEGVFTLRADATVDSTLVYLATRYDEARRRILDRDMQKQRTREQVMRRIDNRYFPGQRRYHAEHRPRELADVVIDNDRLAAPTTVAASLDHVPASIRAAIATVLPR